MTTTIITPDTIRRRSPCRDTPWTRRNVRLSDRQWEKLIELGEAVRPASRQGGKLAYSLALDLLIDHLSADHLSAQIEARRATAKARRRGSY